MASDLFRAIGRLFDKRPLEPEARPSLFVVNRFLAWDLDVAPLAREVSQLRDDAMAWEVWRSVLPRGPGAPRLGYPAPKRAVDDEADLVEAIMQASDLPPAAVRDVVEIAAASGQVNELKRTYGVEET